jgi:hypothetical protein
MQRQWSTVQGPVTESPNAIPVGRTPKIRVPILPIVQPVADVILRRVVVPPVYLPEPRTVKVHRDSKLFGRVK